MVRYELANGEGEAFVDDLAVVAFVTVQGGATIFTRGGAFDVKGSPNDLHTAWQERMNKRAETRAVLRARER